MAVLPWVTAILPLPAVARTISASVASGELRPLANIDGFRAARFGMNEGDLRRAIAQDFGFKEDAIRVDIHPVEKTTVLTIAVDNLLPDTPPAMVSYILGFHTQKLIQVSVLWARENADGLPEAALALQNYFNRMQFQDGKSATGGQLPDGSQLIFRGIDRGGHVVMVSFKAASPEKKEPGSMNLLRVTYAERVDNPDVFILEPGKF